MMIKATVVHTHQRAAQLSSELSRNPDDLALAVPNQVANKLEQLVVDYGYAYRAPNDALIGRKGIKRC